jgi:hypothetical protein
MHVYVRGVIMPSINPAVEVYISHIVTPALMHIADNDCSRLYKD